MPYDINGNVLDPDEPDRSIAKAVCMVLACVLLIALAGYFVSCQPQEQEVAVAAQPSAELSLDTGNAAQMHRYGMPTKADCMQWHLNGQWGFWHGGTLYAFDELPGGNRAWDALYGIDSDNPAFDK